jgi:hypothetical protein
MDASSQGSLVANLSVLLLPSTSFLKVLFRTVYLSQGSTVFYNLVQRRRAANLPQSPEAFLKACVKESGNRLRTRMRKNFSCSNKRAPAKKFSQSSSVWILRWLVAGRPWFESRHGSQWILLVKLLGHKVTQKWPRNGRRMIERCK